MQPLRINIVSLYRLYNKLGFNYKILSSEFLLFSLTHELKVYAVFSSLFSFNNLVIMKTQKNVLKLRYKPYMRNAHSCDVIIMLRDSCDTAAHVYEADLIECLFPWDFGMKLSISCRHRSFAAGTNPISLSNKKNIYILKENLNHVLSVRGVHTKIVVPSFARFSNYSLQRGIRPSTHFIITVYCIQTK